MVAFKTLAFAGVLVGASLSLVPSGASAAAFGHVPAVDLGAQVALPIERVQGYVGQRGYYGRSGYRGRYYARPGYYGRGYGYRRGRVGPAIGLGIAAGALGALAAGAYAAPAYGYGYPAYAAPVYTAPPVYVAPGPRYAVSADDVAYCSRRFRTYDPQSGTYIANDGRPRACP